jgi:hypothetical protein
LAPYSYFDFRYIRFLDNNICLFQGNKYSGILISNDKGKNWIKKDINIQETQFNRNIINSVFALNHSLFLLTGDGIFFSSDLSDSWEKRVNGIADTMFVTSKLLLVDDILFVITDSRQLYRSTNEGISWEICIEGLPEMKYVTSIISFKGQIYAYFSKYGLCKSTDSGNSWIIIKDSEYFNSDYYYYPAWDIPQNNSITTFFVHNDSLFYGTVKTGVNYISEDGSKTFNLSDGLIYRGIGNSAVVGDNIYVGTYGGIFRLTSQASTPENNLTIYPNPASDYLYLSNIYPLDKVEIEIYDSSGKLVINKKIASFTEFPIKIDIRGLAISAYYGYITVDGVKYSVNFIKSRH